MNNTEIKLGDVCPPQNCGGCGVIPTDVWRYTLDADGMQTCYIRRSKGRPVNEIAADLVTALGKMNYEWATLGQTYKYSIGKDRPTDECPNFERLAVFARHGGSEGHIVQVEMLLKDENDPTSMKAKTLFMVKTFGGAAYATRIANRLSKILGIL